MLYPKNINVKLSFDQVLEIAKDHCETDLGRSIYKKLKFTNKHEILSLWLSQTEEVYDIVSEGKLNVLLPLDYDLHEKTAKIQGFFYEIESLQEIYDLLRSIKKVDDFFKNNIDEYPEISKIFKNISIDYSLINQIDKILDPDGNIKPSASPALRKIYSQVKKAENNIFKSSNDIFLKAKDKGLLADTELGIKNGRVVLPVLSEHKRKIHGVLIDQSGTGKVSYIEPIEIVSLNNDLSELLIKKRQEIVRILKNITQQIVINLSEIKKARQHLAFYDYVRSKARLASDWNCVKPNFNSFTLVVNSKHPLLQNRLNDENKLLIPLDYSLNKDNRIIVISGPNAGGKSVALKTIGLLQVMLQHGFLVPCSAESTFQLFENIFIDIGDDQSIDSDLSTYSSHLKSVKHIVNFCDENTLVLMDEIGTGTDPMFGGPIAEAILESIHAKNAFGIITTHFSNIKAKADRLKGVKNAAMLFDIDNLIPMYKLDVGQPGSSFAFEVASNIGLNKKLIKRAKALTDTKQYDLDELLSDVQSQQERLKEKERELNEKLANAKVFEQEYRSLKDAIESQKTQIIQQANTEASIIIKSANKEIEKTIRVIKESAANKGKTDKVRKTLNQKIEKFENNQLTIKSSEISYKIGDQVQVIGSNTAGEIIEIKKNKITIKFGNLVTKTSIDNIEKVGNSTSKQVKKYISDSSYLQKQQNFKTEIDIRGMRTHEALNEVDKFIDSALIMGVSSLRILHGKGNGVLKTEIRKHLKFNPLVLKMTYERVDFGGEGISIIELG
ncbi:MAG: Smr/MutS family protein [Bacteroidia bacterium]|nr:Smr/MutS family protein [Bacteroidia bacterium]